MIDNCRVWKDMGDNGRVWMEEDGMKVERMEKIQEIDGCGLSVVFIISWNGHILFTDFVET